MRYWLFGLCVLFVTIGCKTAKKIQTLQEAISKNDTAKAVIVDKPLPLVDSSAIIKGLVNKVRTGRIDYSTFNARIKVEYESSEKNDNCIAYVSMKKDSLISLKLAGTFLGAMVVGMEVVITRDSIIIIPKRGPDRDIIYKPISYLQEITKTPFDLRTLQDIIIGNAIFIDGSIQSYRVTDSRLLLSIVGETYKHLVTLDLSDNKLLHSKLDDLNTLRNRTCDFTYSNYMPLGQYQFSANRRISLAEKSRLDVYLDFKEFRLNEPLKYLVDPPVKAKRKH
ncbi:MAG: DUF4292 domain-containing protein [Chitinophagaceae bacterium]|nr:DUF4292 domain-containing protein [Chitinophagaceae bacterium]